MRFRRQLRGRLLAVAATACLLAGFHCAGTLAEELANSASPPAEAAASLEAEPAVAAGDDRPANPESRLRERDDAGPDPEPPAVAVSGTAVPATNQPIVVATGDPPANPLGAQRTTAGAAATDPLEAEPESRLREGEDTGPDPEPPAVAVSATAVPATAQPIVVATGDPPASPPGTQSTTAAASAADMFAGDAVDAAVRRSIAELIVGKAGALRPQSSLLLRRIAGPYERGSVLVRTAEKRLWYFVQDHVALEFPIGIARPHLQRIGTTRVIEKRRDPTWIPTALQHRVYRGLPGSMPPGPNNPLGTRALNLTIPNIRIHGTKDDSYIGEARSDGCFHMLNHDIEFLFELVALGSKVVIER